jgi:hypothetical protein
VLQPVEREGVALLDPQVRQSVRNAARDDVGAFFAVERVYPLGTPVSSAELELAGMQNVSAGAACP